MFKENCGQRRGYDFFAWFNGWWIYSDWNDGLGFTISMSYVSKPKAIALFINK